MRKKPVVGTWPAPSPLTICHAVRIDIIVSLVWCATEIATRVRASQARTSCAAQVFAAIMAAVIAAVAMRRAPRHDSAGFRASQRPGDL
eukprot:30593-Prymnesium_polylepis.1